MISSDIMFKAESLRRSWNIDNISPLNILQAALGNIDNLTILWFPMTDELSGCCSKTDDDKIINSLVVFLYKNPSTRKKKLFWYIYGKQLYSNLLENVENKNICRQCGCRTDEVLIRGKCFKCRQEEIKKLDGKKLIKCVDCGKDVIVESRSRTCRCIRCQESERSRINANNYKKKKIQTSS